MNTVCGVVSILSASARIFFWNPSLGGVAVLSSVVPGPVLFPVLFAATSRSPSLVPSGARGLRSLLRGRRAAAPGVSVASPLAALVLVPLSGVSLLLEPPSAGLRLNACHTVASRAVPPGTFTVSRSTSSASASTSRMQYRSSASSLPSCHNPGASHPAPALPRCPFMRSRCDSLSRRPAARVVAIIGSSSLHAWGK